MKKILALLLSLTLVFTLVACAEEAPPAPEPTPTPAPTPEPTPAPEEEATSITGFVNYKFADADLRHTFMAAAEKYLFDTMNGIPMTYNSAFSLWTPRIQAPLDEFLPVVGYGLSFGTFSEDDSNVFIEEGIRGNAGEYTWRSAIVSNPESFNQWTYDGAVTADILSLVLGEFYAFLINDDKTGYDLAPSMASELPVAINPRDVGGGREASRTWQISLRDDLEWFYHPDTDTSDFPAGHEVIDAEDILYTWKTAIDNSWARAVTGSTSFVDGPTAITGANDYFLGLVDWEDVGVTQIDDTTIEVQFVGEQSRWDVTYWLSGFLFTPINEDLFVQSGDQYATDETTVAYTGAYYVDVYEPDKVLRMKANPNYYAPDLYFYTGYNFRVIEESDIIFAEFEAGRLETAGLPPARVEEFRNDPRLRVSPGATTWRLGLNAAGTRDNQQTQRSVLKARGGTIDPNADPEPIMAQVDFRKALYFAIDREFVAREVIGTQDPAPHFFSSAYLVEPEAGIAYRNTPQAQDVNAEYSPETFGYNPDAAVALFDQALAPLVANGTYQEGDVISLLLAYQAGSAAWTALVDYLKPQFEELFVSERYGISVEVELTAVPFPNNYFDYIIPGVSDMGIGGISGSSLNLSSFLSNYRYDNEGTFVLTWGIDTRQADIPIRYTIDGEERFELWSFDAIHKVLNGETYLINGAEAVFPTPSQLTAGFETASFTISNFALPQYTNIRYTLEQFVDGEYVVVDGYDSVLAESRFVSLTGLSQASDYRVTIDFDFTDEAGESDSTDTTFTTLGGE